MGVMLEGQPVSKGHRKDAECNVAHYADGFRLCVGHYHLLMNCGLVCLILGYVPLSSIVAVPNPLFKNRLITKVRNAVQEYKNAAHEGYHGLRGGIREIAVSNLFQPLLPPDIGIGSGKVVDANGSTSAETDVILYSKSLLPPILYNDTVGHFPVESVLFTIEVKSKITSQELRDALKKGAESASDTKCQA